MFRFIKISYVLLIFLDILNAQIDLNETNLASVCSCDPMKSSEISLISKNIRKIDPASFTGLKSLIQLRLQSNQISSINPATFTGLTSLGGLYLYYNQISSIDPATFTGLVHRRATMAL